MSDLTFVIYAVGAIWALRMLMALMSHHRRRHFTMLQQQEVRRRQQEAEAAREREAELPGKSTTSPTKPVSASP